MLTAAPSERTTMLEQALFYLRNEWSVFPVCAPAPGRPGHCQQEQSHKNHVCEKPGKYPLIKWGRYQSTLPTEDEVRGWWRRWPTANIGLATGELSGVVVIDLDGELALREAERRGYEDGPTVLTGRVGGRHLYFRYRDNEPRNFAQVGGIDYRGEGGYTVLPPSLHASGNHYRWQAAPFSGEPLPPLPRWINELAGKGESGHRGPIDINTLLERGVAEGERDTTLFALASKLRALDVPIEGALVIVERAAERCRPPFDVALAREKVARAYQKYQPSVLTDDLIVTSNGHTVNRATGEVVATAAAEPPAPTYPIVQIGTALVGESRDVPHLVEGLVWSRVVHWVFAEPGAGKTLWTLAQALHIAAGKPFLGRPIQQGTVLFIQEDSPLGTAHEYIETLADIYGIDLETVPFYMNRVQGLRITDQHGLDDARRAVAQCPTFPTFVLLDAVERLVPSEKFTSREIDAFDRFLRWYIGEGGTPCVLDHTNRRGRAEKGEKKQTKPKPLDLIYGGQAKRAICDVMTYLDGTLRNGGTVHATWEKFRVGGGESPPPYSLTFNGDDGFHLSEQAQPLSTASQRAVVNFLRIAPGQWYSRAEIQHETGLPDRQIQRALASLVNKRWLLVRGSTSDRSWTLNPEHAGGFFS